MLAFVRYCHLLTYYMYKERRNWKELDIIFQCDLCRSNIYLDVLTRDEL